MLLHCVFDFFGPVHGGTCDGAQPSLVRWCGPAQGHAHGVRVLRLLRRSVVSEDCLPVPSADCRVLRALPRPHAVAIESVGFYRWLWEMLEPIVEELVLADATQARALAGRRLKTDREDALNIAAALGCRATAHELRPADRGAVAA